MGACGAKEKTPEVRGKKTTQVVEKKVASRLEDIVPTLPEKKEDVKCRRVPELSGKDLELANRLLIAVGVDQNPELCIKLLNEGAPVNIVDSEGDAPLHHAIVAPAFHTTRGLAVISFLATKPVLKEVPHALQLAMLSGRVRAAQLLLNLNAPIMGQELVSCASQAAEEDDKESFESQEGVAVLKRIISQCPESVHDTDDHGDTALHLALKNGKASLALLLIEHGVSKEAKDPKGCVPLHNFMNLDESSVQGKILKELLKTPPDAQDDEGDTPLHWTVLFDRPKEAQALIAAGHSKTVANKEGKTPLDLAREKNLASLVKILS